MTFIRSHINVDWAVFTLRTSLGDEIANEDLILTDAGLVRSYCVCLVCPVVGTVIRSFHQNSHLRKSVGDMKLTWYCAA